MKRSLPLIILAPGAAIIAWTPIEYFHVFPVCIFKSVTGYQCPLCGLTTSIILGLHGELMPSLRAHPLGIFVIVLVCLYAMGRMAQGIYPTQLETILLYARSRQFLHAAFLAVLFVGMARVLWQF